MEQNVRDSERVGKTTIGAGIVGVEGIEAAILKKQTRGIFGEADGFVKMDSDKGRGQKFGSMKGSDREVELE